MSRKGKGNTIADRINDALKPKELIEERDDDEVARFEEFNEHVAESNQLSEIRKQTAKHLSEIDSKYKGKAVSRKELGLEADSENSDENLLSESEEEEGDVSGATDDDEQEEDSEGLEQSDGESDESEEEGFGDYDISQFSSQRQSDPASDDESDQEVEDQTVLLSKASTSEEVKKGICVQSQLSIWEKLLEVRIKAQKMLITANSFPDYDSFIELSEIEDSPFAEKAEDACDAIYGLLDNFLELQSTLVQKFSETKNVLKGVKRKSDSNGSILMKKSRLVEFADRIEDNYNAYASFRNQALQKWHDRTKNLKDTKNPITNLNIMTKIENALLSKNEMIRKSQLYRGDYEIYGKENPKVSETNTTGEVELAEIYDDSDFYHQLLRELIEYKSNSGDNQAEITQKFIELQKVRSKMKKRVETRASKGRKIRYNVHNKLLNFMPPRDDSEWTDEAKTELFHSLFGKANVSENAS